LAITRPILGRLQSWEVPQSKWRHRTRARPKLAGQPGSRFLNSCTSRTKAALIAWSIANQAGKVVALAWLNQCMPIFT
jgi:hypothetical protein